MTDKELHIDTEGIQKDNHHSYYNHKYEPTSYDILETLFHQFELRKDDCFVDFGCGKGRLNFYINQRFHCNTIGIELNEDYYLDAQKNLASYQGAYKDRISFHHLAAQDYTFLGTENLFYFFNPFSVEIFGHVIHNIYDSIAEHPRECHLILYYPDPDYLYFLENQTCLTLCKTIPMTGYQKDYRECFMVYRF